MSKKQAKQEEVQAQEELVFEEEVQAPKAPTPAEVKAQAVAEAEARREAWIAERESAKNKYDSLIVQARQFIEFAQQEGDTEEVRALAYEFMHRRYLSGEFDPIK